MSKANTDSVCLDNGRYFSLNLILEMGFDVFPCQKAAIRRFQDEIIGWAEALQTKGNLDEIVQVGTYLMSYGEKDS